MIALNFIVSFVLVALGLYMMIAKKDLIRICIGMGLTDYGANLLIVSAGFRAGGTAPIFVISELTRESFFVDPVPQALTLTSIVIGACTTALTLSLVMMLKKRYGTIRADRIRRLRG